VLCWSPTLRFTCSATGRPAWLAGFVAVGSEEASTEELASVVSEALAPPFVSSSYDVVRKRMKSVWLVDLPRSGQNPKNPYSPSNGLRGKHTQVLRLWLRHHDNVQ
jgi:hypothetical protein